MSERAPTPPLRGSLWLRVRRLLRRAPMPAPLTYPTLLCDDAEQVDALDDYAYRYWT